MSSIIANIIVTVILICIVGAALYYIYKEKKKGTRCIGCPKWKTYNISGNVRLK